MTNQQCTSFTNCLYIVVTDVSGEEDPLLPLLMSARMNKTHLAQLLSGPADVSTMVNKTHLAQLICYLWLLMFNLPQLMADLGTPTLLMAPGESGLLGRKPSVW